MPQFNGKQKYSVYQLHLFCTWPDAHTSLRCPRNGQANEMLHAFPPCPTQPLRALNKHVGRRTRLFSPARIPANKVESRMSWLLNAQALSGKAVRALGWHHHEKNPAKQWPGVFRHGKFNARIR
jgi:hypothetical protein